MSIVMFLLVILITAFWVYQGFFSSMIMFLDVLVAAMLAFAFYEDVHALWAESVGDGLGHALAMMGIFIISLTILRKATDRLIPDDVPMPKPVAMVGGGIFGFFSAMLLTGTALIAIQMMPIGSDVFFYERYSVERDTGKVSSSSLGVFGPDKFTYGLMSWFSADGQFGGGNALSYAKPDFVEQLYSMRAAPQSEAQMFVPAKCIKVKEWWAINMIDHAKHEASGEGKAIGLKRSFETREPEKIGWEYLVSTVYVDKSAAPKNQSKVRFRLPQFRVVGFDTEGKQADGKPSVYLASGMTDIYTHKDAGPFPVDDDQRERLVEFAPMTNFILSDEATNVVAKDNGWEFQVAFRVPSGFQPWYVAFKNGGVAIVPAKPAKEPPSYASRPMGGDGGAVLAQSKQVLSGMADVKFNEIQQFVSTLAITGFGSYLPLPLPSSDSEVQSHLQNKQFGPSGGTHMVYAVPDGYIQKNPDVNEFQVPSGYQMVQVSFNDQRAQSMYGRAIKFAERVAAQTYVTDGNGDKHYAIGNYAIAEADGEWYFEVQYYPNALNEVPERALSGKKARKLTPQVMERAPEQERWFAFLFLVPNSVRNIEKFNTGNGDEITLNLSR